MNPLDQMIADLAREAGVSEQQAAQVVAEAFMESGILGVEQYFENAWAAERWMSFRACDNARKVMSRVEPDLYHEWLQWRQASGGVYGS